MWLPECSEKHVAQLAAARIGMVVAEVDPKLASAEAVGKILDQSGAAVSMSFFCFFQVNRGNRKNVAIFIMLDYYYMSVAGLWLRQVKLHF